MSDDKQIPLFPSFDAKAQKSNNEPRSKPVRKKGDGLEKAVKDSSHDIKPTHPDISEERGGCTRQEPEQKPKSGLKKKKQSAVRKPKKAIAVQSDRFSSYLKVSDVARRLDISVPTVWRWTQERPDFPRPKKFGVRVSRWLLADLIAFESGEVR